MSIPLKAKLALRQLWTNDEAPARSTIDSLQKLLGLQVVCDPDWALLLEALGSAYSQKGDAIAPIVSLIQTWARAAAELLENEPNEQWTDLFLEKIGAGSPLKLFVEVASSASPRTTWDNARGGYILAVPNVQILQATEFLPLLKGQIFDSTQEEEKTTAAAAAAAADEWADIGADVDDQPGNGSGSGPEAKAVAASAVSLPHRARPRVDYLADPATLARPDQLLLKPPYYLFVYGGGGDEVQIEASHSPSLEVLAEYLKKWAQTNTHRGDNEPVVAVELHKGPFGLGLSYSRLVLSGDSRRGHFVSPTIVLSLVENVLGYENTFTDRFCWQFRKDSPLKKL